jgi:hypothetical protein
VARLRRANWVAAVAFAIGGSLFSIGAAVAQIGSGNATTAASIYFAGGLFFNTGGYASLLLAVNEPRGGDPDGEPGRWRWWSYEPLQVAWLSAFLLFAGTIVFGISLLDAFLDGLTTQEQNRLIWTPEMTGCILFLLSGHLAMTDICHRRWPCVRPRDLAWWIVAINQLGSILFTISAVAGFIRPETSAEWNTAVANWGTITGAACFAVGGVLQALDRPAAPAAV